MISIWGQDSLIRKTIVFVTCLCGLVASCQTQKGALLQSSFSFNPSSPLVGQAVQFTDVSTGSPTGWSWSFGDGGTSTARNPSHTYVAAGSYGVSLTVSSASGSDTASETVTVRPEAVGYFVDTNNSGASDSNPGTEALPWKTITKANQVLVPGDTVYIKAGTYTSYIAPARSGTASGRITYKAYGSDTVTIQNASYGIRLSEKSYITVEGINFYNLDRFMYLENGSSSNIIAHCNFDQMRTFIDWAGSRIWTLSSYNWIHHCRFSIYGECSGTHSQGSVLEIGYDDGNAAYCGNHNLIENCTLFSGGHHVLGVHGRYNVIRNNYLYNIAWTNGAGERTLYVNGFNDSAGWNLIEGNRFGYADFPCGATWGAPGTAVSTNSNIMRYNAYFYNNLAGIEFYTADSYNAGPNYNKVYNNTFNDNGWNGAPDPQSAQISFPNYSTRFTIKSNAIKNNLYFDAPTVYSKTSNVSYGDQIFAGNYDGDTSGDPRFVNATSVPGDPRNTSYPDLRLQTGSPAIDAGTYLSRVASADTGSGTTLVVEDASYFYDGTWTLSGTTQGDWVAVGMVGNVVQVQAVDYSTNTITLAGAITRNDLDPIWLYRKSDGVRILYGTAPDAGAHESSSGMLSSGLGSGGTSFLFGSLPPERKRLGQPVERNGNLTKDFLSISFDKCRETEPMTNSLIEKRR
jgi:PKD repeat protein